MGAIESQMRPPFGAPTRRTCTAKADSGRQGQGIPSLGEDAQGAAREDFLQKIRPAHGPFAKWACNAGQPGSQWLRQICPGAESTK